MNEKLDNRIIDAKKLIKNENIIEVFHGSPNIVEKPMYGKGRPKNDFGRGFYCTEIEELAKEWGASVFGEVGYSNKYKLNTVGLNIVNLNSSKYCLMNWLAVLIKNRDFETATPEAKENKEYILSNFYPTDIDKADIIIGYRADDSYFSWAKDFLHDIISIEQLERAMRYGGLGDQIVLMSEKSFRQIEFIDYKIVDDIGHHNTKVGREKEANYLYENLKKEGKGKFDIKASDIREGGLTNDDFCVSKNVHGKGGR